MIIVPKYQFSGCLVFNNGLWATCVRPCCPHLVLLLFNFRACSEWLTWSKLRRNKKITGLFSIYHKDSLLFWDLVYDQSCRMSFSPAALKGICMLVTEQVLFAFAGGRQVSTGVLPGQKHKYLSKRRSAGGRQKRSWEKQTWSDWASSSSAVSILSNVVEYIYKVKYWLTDWVNVLSYSPCHPCHWLSSYTYVVISNDDVGAEGELIPGVDVLTLTGSGHVHIFTSTPAFISN